MVTWGRKEAVVMANMVALGMDLAGPVIRLWLDSWGAREKEAAKKNGGAASANGTSLEDQDPILTIPFSF